MTVIEQLISCADDPFYIRYPPSLFVRSFGLANAKNTFVLDAWRVFKEHKAPISILELRKKVREFRKLEGH